ncbi:MAG: hydantoinase/oxoprolinase family protein [Candidatus Reddybacter sp.]
MGKIINIDNGGTLTDFCVMEGADVHYAKTLTTPYDLSKCFFDGISKVSEKIYGQEDAARLLLEADYVRYSTTQGTNAIVERKGPRLGLIASAGSAIDTLTESSSQQELFTSLVGDRVGYLDTSLSGEALEVAVIKTINEVVTRGAVRVVISLAEADFVALEKRIIRIAQRKFPSHLLGAVPVVVASGLSDEADVNLRTWTALFNAFLHPAMERFLYSADHRLKAAKCNNPLLIFRNDGGTARVAKTTAIKTYSSGPRGGMEGVKALASHYGIDKMLSYDVGGTTTDIGLVENGEIQSHYRGEVEGVKIAFPLANIDSVGVGGSSVISVENKVIKVGPESVGAAPGPACFGLGGANVTITDIAFLAGIFSPETFFGGELNLDLSKSKTVVEEQIAGPLGIDNEQAIQQIIDAWASKISSGIHDFAEIDEQTTFAAFGGAGALLATTLAEKAGINKIIIPGLAAVFSACGIGFSDLSHGYRSQLPEGSSVALKTLAEQLVERARRDMFAEGVDLSECEFSWELLGDEEGGGAKVADVDSYVFPAELASRKDLSLGLSVVKKIKHFSFAPVGDEKQSDAVSAGTRNIMVSPGNWQEVPVYRLEDQVPGATAQGPAIIEEEYFTGKINENWQFHISSNRDVLIEKN